MGISRSLSRRLDHLEGLRVDPMKALIQSLPQEQLEAGEDILNQLIEVGTWTPELMDRARSEVPNMVQAWGLEDT